MASMGGPMTQLTPLPPELTPTKPAVRTATTLLRTFAAHGVRAAFGIPGGAIGPLFDALAEVPEIELVSTRHETTAVFAAIGHARVTGIPALVLVTSGPGTTNAVTGIASALLEEVPLIVLAGDVATTWSGRGAFQDGSHVGLDVVALMRSVTRWCGAVYTPSMAAGAAAQACAIATGDRPGPVFLSVPYDIAQSQAGVAPIAMPSSSPARPDVTACREAAELLVSSRRPLLVLGNGARRATEQSVALAERVGSPVVVTSHAKGAFPEDHPLYLGLIGNAGHPSARDYVASSPDVVCVVGSRLGDFATNGWKLPVAGRVATIQIDRDPLIIGRNAPVTLGLAGDAGECMRAICAHVPDHPRPIRECVALRTRPWSTDAPVGTVKPQQVVLAIQEAFPDAIFCSDIGEHMGFAQHYLTIERPERFHCMTGLGSMGSGLGAAIGIKLARPDSTVVVFVGDGGFNMHVSELLACVEHRIGVVFAVFNDGCWNMVEHGFRAVFQRRPANLPARVADLASVARGYGAVSCVIDHPAQLEADRLRRMPQPGLPLVLDIRTDRSESLSIDSRSAALVHVKAR
jgi:acetolactate synthase I/II/III large subunit